MAEAINIAAGFGRLPGPTVSTMSGRCGAERHWVSISTHRPNRALDYDGPRTMISDI